MANPNLAEYIHVQDTPMTVWTVNHDLSSPTPIVQVVTEFEGKDEVLIPSDIEFATDKRVVITFQQARTGTARLK